MPVTNAFCHSRPAMVAHTHDTHAELVACDLDHTAGLDRLREYAS